MYSIFQITMMKQKFILIKEIKRNINKLNKIGVPIIFLVTGNNSCGKTTFSRSLIRNFNFSQTVNLGIISKLIRFFKPEINCSNLENFSNKEIEILFKNLTDFIINHYSEKGVNLIIEGVQLDTLHLEKNKQVTGGIILDVEKEISISRGQNPDTRFKRSLKKIKNRTYFETEKFKIIDNNKNIHTSFRRVLNHLNCLLIKAINEHR